MGQPDAGDTRARLLSAAEELLLSAPYDDVSIRAICAAAGANTAAVHYHFGSKETLVAALLEDRIVPAWSEAFTALVERDGSVIDLVDAVLDSFARLSREPTGRMYLRLIAKLVTKREAEHPAELFNSRWFQIESWAGLLSHVSPEIGRRRWMLAFDLIITRFAQGGWNERGISREALVALRDFVVGGLTAPGVSG